jgi:hypothetical protein
LAGCLHHRRIVTSVIVPEKVFGSRVQPRPLRHREPRTASAPPAEAVSLEVVMQRFIHNENIARYRKLIALGERDPVRDEARHQMLLRLLAEEEKDKEPPAA